MRQDMVLFVFIWFFVISAPLVAAPNEILWNVDCPLPFGATLDDGMALQKELPDWQDDLRLQFQWLGGQPCRDPNRAMAAEIAMTDKIISDILRPAVRPVELPAERHLFLSKVACRSRTTDAIVVQWKRDPYIVKVMKTVGPYATAYVTIRRVSSEDVNVPGFATEVFSDRLLPERWDEPFYIGSLKRASVTIRGGMWNARDTTTIDASGKVAGLDSDSPVAWGPVGQGRYKRIDFCTNGKFLCLKILGGPPATRVSK
jgi:hypothetical protein